MTNQFWTTYQRPTYGSIVQVKCKSKVNWICYHKDLCSVVTVAATVTSFEFFVFPDLHTINITGTQYSGYILELQFYYQCFSFTA